MANLFFIDTLKMVPLDADCYIQAPDLDKNIVKTIVEICDMPYYIKIRLHAENIVHLVNLEFNCNISQWIQSMEIRNGSDLLFEGYDAVRYGTFSKNMSMPTWFKEKYQEDFFISNDW